MVYQTRKQLYGLQYKARQMMLYPYMPIFQHIADNHHRKLFDMNQVELVEAFQFQFLLHRFRTILETIVDFHKASRLCTLLRVQYLKP